VRFDSMHRTSHLHAILTLTFAFTNTHDYRYWFVIQGFASSFGAYQVTVSCGNPLNSTPPTPAPTAAPTATPIAVVVGTLTCGTDVTGNTTGRDNTVGSQAPEEWWMFTAPATGLYIFDSCGSNYDT
jgi:hypothetical protein